MGETSSARQPPPAALALAAFMLVAGLAHFVVPENYRRLVPRAVGDAAFWVRWTGVAEIACAASLLHRRSRRAGALATIAILVTVFPANVKMALDGGIPDQPFPLGSPVVAWARLPLQVPLVVWAWCVARRAEEGAAAASTPPAPSAWRRPRRRGGTTRSTTSAGR